MADDPVNWRQRNRITAILANKFRDEFTSDSDVHARLDVLIAALGGEQRLDVLHVTDADVALQLIDLLSNPVPDDSPEAKLGEVMTALRMHFYPPKGDIAVRHRALNLLKTITRESMA